MCSAVEGELQAAVGAVGFDHVRGPALLVGTEAEQNVEDHAEQGGGAPGLPGIGRVGDERVRPLAGRPSWQNPELTALNALPAKASFVPHPAAESARDQDDRASEWFQSLDGNCRFPDETTLAQWMRAVAIAASSCPKNSPKPSPTARSRRLAVIIPQGKLTTDLFQC